VIGVYEPIVVTDDRGSRCTSLAAEPELSEHGAELQHVSCEALVAREPHSAAG